MNEVIVYTKNDCRFCTLAKNLLTAKNILFTSINMPDEISRDELLEMFPTARTMPIVVVDGEWIGGYTQLERKINAST